jgi:Na+-transporting methylmalonyl-CoA/oxaloacetate decarboxylase gamma subunit
LAGLGVAFLLLVLLVQVTAAVSVRNTVEAAVGASARRAARPGADPAVEENRLAADLAGAVPGAVDLHVRVTVGREQATAGADLVFRPPGPLWKPVTIEASAVVARVVPP